VLQLKDNYSVDLDVFQGPLDLLLYLIKKEEIDIYDIPVARVTEQYMQYLDMMKVLNLELAGEYILMAATLIKIKARLLLPRDEESEDDIDPREELIAALLEYRKFKEAGDILREKRLLEERLYVPPGIGSGNGRQSRTIISDTTTLFDLLTAFKEIQDRFDEERRYEVNPEENTIEDRIDIILEILAEKKSATFMDLFADIPRKIIAILTFLALLELVKNRYITIRQSLPFSELRVYQSDNFAEARQTLILKRGSEKDQEER
jgi:segregation and condensation protein A